MTWCRSRTIYHEIVQGSVKRNRFAEYIENLPHPRGSVILLHNCNNTQKFGRCMSFNLLHFPKLKDDSTRYILNSLVKKNVGWFKNIYIDSYTRSQNGMDHPIVP
jgi:hypothetical protein